jgi:sugar phosphate permease
VIAGGLFATAVLLLLLGAGRPGPALGVALVGFTGFAMLGPYSYLAGVVSLDFGGKAGSATACGVIDGVGYFGGILAGSGIARVVVLVGWDVAFQGLAAIALATGLLALGFARTEAPARELG